MENENHNALGKKQISHGTIPQIAAVTEFPESRLRRLVRSGAIPSVKIGNRYIVKTDDVMKWLNGELGNLYIPEMEK